jgi:hypothetical protein
VPGVPPIEGVEAVEPVGAELVGPELVGPEPLDPEPVEPEPVEPDPVEPDPVEPDPVEPEPVEPDPVEPEPVEPELPEPEDDEVDEVPELPLELLLQPAIALASTVHITMPVAFLSHHLSTPVNNLFNSIPQLLVASRPRATCRSHHTDVCAPAASTTVIICAAKLPRNRTPGNASQRRDMNCCARSRCA